MRIITSLDELHIDEHSAVAVGKFDGIHVGHKKIIDEILAAKADGLLSVIFTFDPAPEIFFGFQDAFELMTKQEKRDYFEASGIDVLIEYPMNPVTAALDPEVFVREYISRRMNASLVVAGSDLSFGAKGRGDFNLLNALKKELGFETLRIEKVSMDGDVVSSTRIRSLVQEGRMKEAARLLGRPYSFKGIVRHGRQLGRTIGMPTANIIPEDGKILPPYGVYHSRCILDGKEILKGISNIGRKPTVKNDTAVNIETFLFDWDKDIYGCSLEVEFMHFARPEKKFGSVEELKAAMQADIETCRKDTCLI
ncbi:MAG: riboflavin biosynthesis protein RibF [Lachnospiraceae bacterium]|nr:riboflavin biosynthesis protein RibF [Lachnospiraceae bacterium]